MRLIGLFNLLRRGGILAQRRQFGLSEIEWRIMTQVGQHAPLSLNGLAELLLQDRGQLSRTVKAMVKSGLLIRQRKAGGPAIEISLAPGGEALYARMVRRALERDRRLTSGMSATDLATLRRITDDLVQKAEDMMEEEWELGSAQVASAD
jgi:DNA-binding MarR family transcriptional regulator